MFCYMIVEQSFCTSWRCQTPIIIVLKTESHVFNRNRNSFIGSKWFRRTQGIMPYYYYLLHSTIPLLHIIIIIIFITRWNRWWSWISRICHVRNRMVAGRNPLSLPQGKSNEEKMEKKNTWNHSYKFQKSTNTVVRDSKHRIDRDRERGGEWWWWRWILHIDIYLPKASAFSCADDTASYTVHRIA